MLHAIFSLLDLFLQFCAKGALLRQWLAVAVDCGHTHTPIRDRQRKFARRLADVLFANLFGDVASEGGCLYCTSTVPIKAQDLKFSAFCNKGALVQLLLELAPTDLPLPHAQQPRIFPMIVFCDSANKSFIGVPDLKLQNSDTENPYQTRSEIFKRKDAVGTALGCSAKSWRLNRRENQRRFDLSTWRADLIATSKF